MLANFRANFWLTFLTLGFCCVAYPLALLAVGQGLFPYQANGSLIEVDGKVVGSRLIAQEVKSEEHFQPRVSAASYNGAQSGASNYGASNPALRDRVARSLATLTSYAGGAKKGQPVAPDVVRWFQQERPDLVAHWASAHSGAAQSFVKSDDVMKDYVKAWLEKHPQILVKWREANPGTGDVAPEDLAVPFFESFALENPGTWLTVSETKNDKGESEKKVKLVRKGDEDSADIASVFFDLWRSEHPDVALEAVPADLVTASASGLDPHITYEAALFQLDRVTDRWVERTKGDRTAIRKKIADILEQRRAAPLGGTAGVDLVDVLEVNLAVDRAMARAEDLSKR